MWDEHDVGFGVALFLESTLSEVLAFPNYAIRHFSLAYRGLDIGECFLGVFDGAAVEAHRFAVCISLPGTPHARRDAFGVEHGHKPHHLLVTEGVRWDGDDADALVAVVPHLTKSDRHVLEVDLGFS